VRSLLISVLFSLGLGQAAAGFFGPSTYDECILEELKSGMTDTQTVLVMEACRNKFSSQKESTNGHKEGMHSPVEDISGACYVYWDGRGWKKGQTNGDRFYRLKFGRYGVHTHTASIPSEMAKEFSIKRSDAGSVNTESGPFAEFLGSTWYQIDLLCGF